MMFNFHFTDLGTKIVDKLRLSYRSVQELNSMIDTELSGRSCFQCHMLDIGDEKLEFFCRDILECIRSLYGDPSWAQDMAFAPERHYTSHVWTSRIYNELYTSDWWWTIQVSFFIPGANNILMSSTSGTLRGTTTRGYNCTCDCILGQDTAYSFQKQDGIPSVPYDWQHPDGHLLKTITPCPNPGWVYSNNQVGWHGEQDWSPSYPGQPIPFLHAEGTRPNWFRQ